VSEYAMDQPQPEIDLVTLTGRQLDPEVYRASILPHLEFRGGKSIRWYAERQLMLSAPLIAKVVKHGNRTPTAPHLSEITERLERALHMSKQPVTEARLLELLAHFEQQVGEAEEHFYG
jgi:hypothetical protein